MIQTVLVNCQLSDVRCKIYPVLITISALHLEKTKSLESYTKEKAQKLLKFHSKIEKIEVRLIGEKSHRSKSQEFTCEIKIVIPGHDLEIRDTESSIEAAVDKAEERAKRILVKNKEKHLSLDHKKGIVNKLVRRFSS